MGLHLRPEDFTHWHMIHALLPLGWFVTPEVELVKKQPDGPGSPAEGVKGVPQV